MFGQPHLSTALWKHNGKKDITTWAQEYFVKHMSVNTDACKVLHFIYVVH